MVVTWAHSVAVLNAAFCVVYSLLIFPENAEYIDEQHYTTNGNSPKGSGSYLGPNTHIQHTYSQHPRTCTQLSTYN